MSFLNFIINQIFPEQCPSCTEGNLNLGRPLCDTCLEKIEETASQQRCKQCGDLLNLKSCSCSERNFFFKKFFSVWLYDRQGRKLLKQAKFDKRPFAVRYIKKNIPVSVWEILEKLENSAMLILPSSHSFLKNVAKFLASESSMPIYNIFYKKKKKLQSKIMHEKERFLQIEKNLAIDSPTFEKINRKNYVNFLLVDDIWTSGATMNFAAKLLSEQRVDTKNIATLALFRRDKKQVKIQSD